MSIGTWFASPASACGNVLIGSIPSVGSAVPFGAEIGRDTSMLYVSYGRFVLRMR